MEKLEIPESASVFAIFSVDDTSGEGFSCLGIDPVSSASAPVGESFRVDISPSNDVPLSLKGVLRFLRSLDKFLPSGEIPIGVFTDSKEGRVIFLPNPDNSGGSNVVIG